MLRRLVRSYYRLRYFPRLLVQMLSEILAELKAVRTTSNEGTALDNMHQELSSFCDDSVRYMMRSTAEAADQATRLVALQSAVVRTEESISSTGAQCRDAVQQVLTALDRLQSEIGAMHAQTKRDGTLLFEQASTQIAGLAEKIQILSDEVHRSDMADRVQSEIAGLRIGTSEMRDGIAAQGDAIHRQDGKIAEIYEALKSQTAEIGRVGRIASQQARMFPSVLWDPDTGERVRKTLDFLKPVGVRDVGKIRMGRDLDGGYVMLDDFFGIGGAVSAGIANDASWDLDVAARGIDVFQFDPSVPGPPEDNERFHFERLRIVPRDLAGGISLDTVVQEKFSDSTAPLLLKMDIEGNEWDVLSGLGEETLLRFRQIVCEFHDLDRLGEPEFRSRAYDVFAKLARFHAVIHVHGNNCSNFANVGNVMVPQSLEISFALRSAYHLVDELMIFPTRFDRPNQPGRADLFLGHFHFDA